MLQVKRKDIVAHFGQIHVFLPGEAASAETIHPFLSVALIMIFSYSHAYRAFSQRSKRVQSVDPPS